MFDPHRTRERKEAPPSGPVPAPDLHSIESEQLVLAAALFAARKQDEGTPAREQLRQQLLDLLADEDFFLDQHANIWRIIRQLTESGRSADPAAIVDASNAKKLYIGGGPFLMGLLQNPVHRSALDRSVTAAASRVKDLSLLRQMEAALNAGRAFCNSGLSFQSVSTRVLEDIQNLARKSTTSKTGPIHVREHTDAIIESLMNPEAAAALNQVTPTGFESIDSVIYGLADEDFIILAARPSMGKTSFALALAEQTAKRNVAAAVENAAIKGKDVLIFSLEMAGAALTRRMLSRASRISMNTLRRGAIGESEWERISEATEKLFRTEVWIDDTPGLTISEIRSRARAFAREHPDCLIIVDYLQFVAVENGADSQTHAARVSKALKELARELKCPVIALSQLNRSVEQRPNKRPMLSDLRDSGSLEQDADLIVFLYRDEYYNKDSKQAGMAEAIIAKQREGATATVVLGYEGKTMTWTDLAQSYGA